MNESSPAWRISDGAESVQAFDDAVLDGVRRVEEVVVAVEARTGTPTIPKLIEPVHGGRGMHCTHPFGGRPNRQNVRVNRCVCG